MQFGIEMTCKKCANVEVLQHTSGEVEFTLDDGTVVKRPEVSMRSNLMASYTGHRYSMMKGIAMTLGVKPMCADTYQRNDTALQQINCKHSELTQQANRDKVKEEAQKGYVPKLSIDGQYCNRRNANGCMSYYFDMFD